MKQAGKHRAIVVVSIIGILLLLAPPGLCAGAGPATEREVFRQGGTLQAVGGQVIHSSVPEWMKVLFVVPAGERVEKGDLLVELDAAPLLKQLSDQQIVVKKAERILQLAETVLAAAEAEGKAEIELAEQGLKVAQLELEAYLAGEYPMHKREARSAVQLAKERLMHRKEHLAYAKAEAHAGERELQVEAQLAVSEAKIELAAAENRLQLIELMHPLQKAQREMAVSERKFSLMRMKNDRQRTVLERQNELTVARERYVKLHKQLDLWQSWAVDCKLYAPRGGLVLHGDPGRRRRAHQSTLEPGKRVGSEKPLVEVVDPHRFAIEMVVARETAKRIEKGNDAVVRVDALPEERFQGRFTEVEFLAGRTDKSVVTVQFEDPEGRLRIGMSAMVEIAF